MGNSGDVVMGMSASEFKPIKEGATKEELDFSFNTLIFKDYTDN